MEFNKTYLKYLCCLLPFMLSAIVYTQTTPAFARVLLVLKMAVFLYIVKEYIEDDRFSKFDAALGIYLFIWLISVLINGTGKVGYIKEIVVIVSHVFMIENAFSKKEEKHLLFALEHLLFFLLTVNFAGLILYQEGVWTTYSLYGQEAIYSFLGLYNQVTPILIVAEFSLLMRFNYDSYRVSWYSAAFAIVLAGNIYMMRSATGIIGCVLVPLVMWLGFIFREHINIKTVSVIVICITLIIVVFRRQDIFTFLIEDVFKKDLNLTNRVGIWDRAVEMIKEKPLIGYGCGSLEAIVVDRNAHDFYLQIMLQCGLIGFASYVNIFYTALKTVWKNKTLNGSIIVAAALCGYMICSIVEVYNQLWLMIILISGYNVMAFPEEIQPAGEEDAN